MRNLEAEMALLGAAIANGDVVRIKCADLLPEHFSEDLHGRMWAEMKASLAEGHGVSAVALSARMSSDPAIKEVGGAASYIAKLVSMAAPPLQISDYRDTIIELAQRRAEHRSPLVARCVEDYQSGRRLPLDAIYQHPWPLQRG